MTGLGELYQRQTEQVRLEALETILSPIGTEEKNPEQIKEIILSLFEVEDIEPSPELQEFIKKYAYRVRYTDVKSAGDNRYLDIGGGLYPTKEKLTAQEQMQSNQQKEEFDNLVAGWIEEFAQIGVNNVRFRYYHNCCSHSCKGCQVSSQSES